MRYLVDIRAVPREIDGLPAVLHARVRDLDSDEEKYVGSIAELGEFIDARLDADGITPRRWERP